MVIFGQFFFCLGSQLAHNPSYHSQSDWKIEIVNKFLKVYHHLFAYDKKTHQVVSWKNGGTTHPSILHRKCPHLLHFMDIILHLSHHP